MIGAAGQEMVFSLGVGPLRPQSDVREALQHLRLLGGGQPLEAVTVLPLTDDPVATPAMRPVQGR
jgi:hypothetical protein